MKIDKKTYEAMPADLQAMFDKLPNPARDEATAGMPETGKDRPHRKGKAGSAKFDGKYNNGERYENADDQVGGYADSGSAARFFACCEPDGDEPNRYYYCAKSSRRERDMGLPDGKRSIHPTHKPISLTRYLATLVLPPDAYLDEAALLVPFCGVGSEMIGALLAGWRNVVGIELDAEGAGYCGMGRARLAWWADAMQTTGETDPKEILKRTRKPAAPHGREVERRETMGKRKPKEPETLPLFEGVKGDHGNQG